MPRQLAQPFKCEPLADLSRQLLFAPTDRRLQQVYRTERLHDEIQADRTYPLDFIVFRITGFRRDGSDATLLVGEAVQPDLRLIIDKLSQSLAIPPDAQERIETVSELAERLNVSTKTIARWRKIGLRWRWVTPENGRPHIVFPAKAVDRFVAQHAERIARAGRFTQIEPAQRQVIIDRARRIAQDRDVSLNRVATHLAAKTGRAVETIRQLLEKHDLQHPNDPIFVDRTGPLTDKQRKVIARAFRRGVPATRLARHFRRTRPTIYRVVNEMRLQAARQMQLPFVSSPTFSRPDADAVYLRAGLNPASAMDGATWSNVAVDDLPDSLQPLFRQRVPTQANLRSLFLRYNYLRFKACQIRDALGPYELRAADLNAIDACVHQAADIYALLVRVHLPVVLSVARRQMIGEENSGQYSLQDLIEAGLTALAEAVQSFNASRNVGFESFLTNRLLQCFASGQHITRPLGQARRRLSEAESLQRLADIAARYGVDLTPREDAAVAGYSQ